MGNTDGDGTDTAAVSVSDDELITCWGLVHEAVTATDPLLLHGVGPSTQRLPAAEFEVLLRLLRSPECRLPMGELAREVSLTSGGLTKVVDRLRRLGYLERTPCPEDRRISYAVLTRTGREVAQHAHDRHATLLRRHVLDVLGPRGVRDLSSLARRLRDAARCTPNQP
ncbi:MarR family transcriptional regulator [Lipingzhangella sp. LS1_29]|uniref:MarR family transcriptional regulator n=1 Tax=Lipingzhangella rawalii TaxID=2055835 RepID=A0ABU2H7X3_9ACTN|nr:MarR family transcriptional regulator [Lipingzhangella rawalii]MDS1271383.1 MarR family transcriptional regulator [Lipingzhangella rawalii]